MNQERKYDVFTGYPVGRIINWAADYQSGHNPDFYEYFCEAIGYVKLITSTFFDLHSNAVDSASKEVIAGVLRNLYENKKEFSYTYRGKSSSFIIPAFITEKLYEQQFEYPKNFKDKAFHLLTHLYMKGGGEYHTFDLYSHKDYTLIYGSEDEFKRIINFLTEEELLNSKKTSTKDTILFEVTMTSKGIKKVEKKESDNFSQTLHEALSKDEIDLAIKLFEDSFTNSSIKLELVQISARLSHLDKNNRLGTLSLDDYTRHRNQIRVNLLEIIEKYYVNN